MPRPRVIPSLRGISRRSRVWYAAGGIPRFARDDTNTLRRWLALLLLLFVLAPASQASGLFEIDVRKVVDGVYVASRPEPLRPFVEGNVTIIVNDADVIVVDAGGSPQTARKVIAAIRALTPNPVRYLVFTHIHRDHRFGAQEYVRAFPGVEIIAHPLVREVVSRSGDAFVATTIGRIEAARAETLEEIARLEREDRAENARVIAFLRRYAAEDAPAAAEAYRGVRNVAPTATVAETLTIRRGARTIEVRFLGHGDTDHDLVVYLPKEGVVCTGDMVVHPFPYGYSTKPLLWRDTLVRLNELPYRHLIPGHGAVQHDKTYVRSIVAMLDDLRSQVGGESATERVDLRRHEAAMVGDDPVGRYYFRKWFLEPAAKSMAAAVRNP